jgi:RNA polymerase sigma factor (sigma-70 family)
MSVGTRDTGLGTREELRNAEVVRWLPLVHKIANRFFHSGRPLYGMDRNDLFQIGVLGLIKAVESSDSGKSITCLSYYTKAIYWEMNGACVNASHSGYTDRIEYTEITEEMHPSANPEDRLVAELSIDFLLCILGRLEQLVIRGMLQELLDSQLAKDLALYPTSIKRIRKRALAKMRCAAFPESRIPYPESRTPVAQWSL